MVQTPVYVMYKKLLPTFIIIIHYYVIKYIKVKMKFEFFTKDFDHR
jgi:hypothetical protein